MRNIEAEVRLIIFHYLVCITSYRFAKDVWQAIANLLSNNIISGRTVTLVVMVYFAYFLMFLCGVLMGFLAKRKIIVHSCLAAMAGVALDIYFVTGMTVGDSVGVIFMLANGAVLGSIGGVVAMVLKNLNARSNA